MRVLAFDGTRLMLPSYKTMTHEFDVQHVGPNKDVANHMVLAYILYDTENWPP